MEDYIQKIEGWMTEFRDNETELGDYEFLDEALTRGNTLGNIESYLPVYEENGELYIDDNLLRALDRKKTEIAKDGSNISQKHKRTNQS